jgi:hypothetical protein
MTFNEDIGYSSNEVKSTFNDAHHIKLTANEQTAPPPAVASASPDILRSEMIER